MTASAADPIALALARGDGRAAAHLYESAASTSADPAARRFLLTHAWVHALETGAPEADRIEGALREAGGL